MTRAREPQDYQPVKDELIRKARQADTASHIDEWINSPGLQAPK